MKAVIQRAIDANVTVDGTETGAIDYGLVVLAGVTHDDTEEDADYLADKLVNLRIFDDENGKMNHSLKETGGKVLSISQFTLYADTRKGRRPNYLNAAKPEQAASLYDYLNQRIEQHGIAVETGEFGAMMNVQLTNSGPVTIILDTKDR
ncbi:D-tyrosyl-tRNA(Tyr) deacylase [Lentibacillus cibarius]|uniref:D-aminoacyl-tRNA deacylase n=1 Tax=Lentibacillus cibarius TaxID=2583219 RepID=A0A549YLP4_9BACI|nr:D-aminoacyl-tRNA deacylase [Lentibacillus cibarius]TRM08739.1 D-tyrosyl-tRNA(Tyr) deacylase [Lentibacillus cibarius]TRM12803.1 D-tyrosyl-tRNA(Tyr) deacylase [Lentibacillus cibarius]